MASPPPRSDVTLYFDTLSASTLRVMTALHEKQVDFDKKPLDPSKGENLQTWFLQISPTGSLPVLRHKDCHIVGGATDIVAHVNENLGRPGTLCAAGEAGERVRAQERKIDAIPIDVLAVGVACFWPEGVTERLHAPFEDCAARRARKALATDLPEKLKRLGIDYEQAEEERALLLDRQRTVDLLELVESIFDEMEAVLGADDRLGMWLCGPTFSSADVALTCLMFTLETLGLDEHLWKGGRRPNLAVYQELAYRRPSIQRATDWQNQLSKSVKISKSQKTSNGGANGINSTGNGGGDVEVSDDGLAAAKVGLGAVLVLGGMYAARKLLRR